MLLTEYFNSHAWYWTPDPWTEYGYDTLTEWDERGPYGTGPIWP